MTNYYELPITDRVLPFLTENPHVWYTVHAIAGETHLVDWQVRQQLTPLVESGAVAVESDPWTELYRLKGK